MFPGMSNITGGAGGMKGGTAKSGSKGSSVSNIKIDQTGLGAITFGAGTASTITNSGLLVALSLGAMYFMSKK